VNTFSSVKKTKSAAKWENFRSSLRAVLFASVSSCTHHLKRFSCRSICMSRTTDAFFRDISRTVLWVWGWSSWLRTISFTCNVFIRAGTSQSVAALTSVHYAQSLNLFSDLLMLLVVHPLSENSVLNCLALYPFNWYNFLKLECYLRRWKPCLQTM